MIDFAEIFVFLGGGASPDTLKSQCIFFRISFFFFFFFLEEKTSRDYSFRWLMAHSAHKHITLLQEADVITFNLPNMLEWSKKARPNV